MSSDGTGLTGLWFDDDKYGSRADAKAASGDSHEESEANDVFAKTRQWLDIYFAGKDPGFTPPLVMNTTQFRKKVWEIMLEIPYGKTTTYGEIAARIAEEKGTGHMSAQAVGNAVGHNDISLIIPCHRVIGADGSLTGYAAGIDKKEKLLRLESGDEKLAFAKVK